MRTPVAITALAVLALAACSSGDPDSTASATPVGSVDQISIVNTESLAPDLEFEPGLIYREPETQVVWDGDGPALTAGQPILLDIYAESLDDGGTLINTFDGLPRSFLLGPEFLGDGLFEALTGASVGTRLLHVAPPSELIVTTASPDDALTPTPSEPAIALVIDVLPTAATGEAAAPREDLPVVITGAMGEPTITIRAEAEPPPELEVATLIQGSGSQIHPGSFVMVNYKAVHWGDDTNEEPRWLSGDEFDSSWPVDKAPFQTQIGVGQVIRGWDEGLLDKTAGSQVMLVVPPSFGYPDQGTLVFVVDILDVWTPEE